ncbi:sterol desaturase/sphingolipid hydroxylase (fatty acid hydroxylase superfamily) [Sphingomonas kaistensis]|uniref:Sterol desaturase/sphingolipid hydroxylase (Fatty acid hydroxylase superfamily) n=1 Tax=Sphingomonas kaistensis TaxID=298708 RepID=A0A7X6BG22_9SPHN|nr:sterol desaturase/sphingolipid hydroxylase (fatty acid hydroxylase superfamily) [Sphingomonas kaistensis]
MLATAFVLALCTVVERLASRGTFRWGERWPGVLFGLLNPVFAILIAIPLKLLWAKVGVAPVVHLSPLGLGVVGTTLLTLLATDFLMYWEHRFEHRFMWPVHAVHHSVEHLSAANSFSHPAQFVPMFAIISVPLSLVDFGSVAVPALVSTTVFFLQLFIHSPVKLGLGPLRHIFVDPPFHRIHHSLEERHFDRNFSILFSFWDRVFGTQVMPAKDQWPEVGIHEARSPRSVAELLTFPLRLWGVLPPLAAATSEPDETSALPEPDAAANRHSALGV